MPIQRDVFRILHRDPFDNVTVEVGEKLSFAEAEIFVEERYRGRIAPEGADLVKIVDSAGNVLRTYRIR